MSAPAERRNLGLMRAMFHTIAPRYDFITRVFSYGMDGRWKRAALDRCALPPNARVLDLACGTGDFSALIAQRYPHAQTVAADLTERMLHLARARGAAAPVCADACRLPFPDRSFDAVFVGYGLRNFPDLRAAVDELARVTLPGGMLVSLDFFLPHNPLLRAAFLAYLYAQGAFWGVALHGRPRVYTYIPHSLRAFVSLREFSTLLRGCGYATVSERAFILGGIGLHWAAKE